MAYCPVCKNNWDDNLTECPICTGELQSSNGADAESANQGWILLGYVSDKMSADYAKEVLHSYEIPAVVISKSGFFGQAGLILPGFYKSGMALFEVSVPFDQVVEAVDIMNMVLGDKWQPADQTGEQDKEK